MTEAAQAAEHDYRLFKVGNETFSTAVVERTLSILITGMDIPCVFILLGALTDPDTACWHEYREAAKCGGPSKERLATTFDFLIAAREQLTGEDLKFFMRMFMIAGSWCEEIAAKNLKTFGGRR